MSFLKTIGHTLGEGTKNAFKEVKDYTEYKIHKEIYHTKKKMIKTLTVFLILALAGISLILSLVFFMTEYLLITKTIAFLTLGIVLMLIGLIIK